jgi:hypothetical protein
MTLLHLPASRQRFWELSEGTPIICARSGEEDVMVVDVSHRERIGVIRRIRRVPVASCGPPEWVPADAIDEGYAGILPKG